MQIVIQKSALVEELQICGSIAQKKTTIPILGTLKMEADSQGLLITGTDLECSIQSRVDAKVGAAGAVCLPAHRLLALSRSLPEGEIKITVSDKMWATITAGKTKARIAGQSPEVFPILPTRPDAEVSLQARLLGRQIDLVKYAVSDGTGKFTLAGFLMQIGDSVECIATDGHRLICTCGKVEEAISPRKFIVPRNALGVIPKLIEGSAAGSRIEISSDDNHLFFAVEGRVLCCRRLSGSFPDYHRVLPKFPLPCCGTVDRKQMIEALGQVINFADSESRLFVTEVRDGEVGLSSESLEAGECDTSIAAETSGAMKFGMNGAYVLDAFNSLSSEKVEIWGTGDMQAVEFRPAGEGNYRCVIMPMRK